MAVSLQEGNRLSGSYQKRAQRPAPTCRLHRKADESVGSFQAGRQKGQESREPQPGLEKSIMSLDVPSQEKRWPVLKMRDTRRGRSGPRSGQRSRGFMGYFMKEFPLRSMPSGGTNGWASINTTGAIFRNTLGPQQSLHSFGTL
jgi:hypothetical protein